MTNRTPATLAALIISIAVFLFFGTPAVNAQQIVLGASVPIQSGMIQNVTPAYCAVFAFGEKFADAGPGTTIYVGAKKGRRDINPFRNGYGWYAGSSGVQVPIVALCYSDPQETQYVGAANTIFQVAGGGYSGSNSWVIRAADIRTMDGQPQITPRPMESRLRIVYGKLPFPKSIFSGWQAIQIVNNSRLAIAARTIGGGVQPAPVQSNGGIYYVKINGNLPVVVDLKATDPATGRLVGVWSQTFYSGPQLDITAQNIVLQESSFTR